MFGSPILDVAIGLVFIYLLLSVIASSVREWLEAIVRSRAAQLERGMRELLNDPKGNGLAAALYAHPLIAGLYRGTYTPGVKRGPRFSDLPSYIPKENFALALIDVVVRGKNSDSAEQAGPDSLRIDPVAVRARIASIQNPGVQRALLVALDTAAGDLDRFRRNVENWFDGSMDRISGWYKRETQHFLLAIGLLLAVGGNIDTIRVAQYLYKNKPARDAIVARATQTTQDSAQANMQLAQAERALDSLRLPIGWSPLAADSTSGMVHAVARRGAWIGRGVASGWVGWLLTAFAVSFGAPFWFDLLNRLMVVRSTVKPKEKSGDEGPKDRTDASTPSMPVVSSMTAPAVAPTPAAPDFEPHAWKDGDPNAGLL